MGVFGGRTRARLKKRVQRELQSPSWQVLVHGRTWLCPFCAGKGVKQLPEAEAEVVEAILDHLDGACPRFESGEGEELPLVELRRAAARRELRRRVKRELVKNPSWQLIDVKRRWFCPFCGDGTGVTIPADRRMKEEVLGAILGHVEGCYAFRHGTGREKPLSQLKANIKASNQSRKLVDNARRKLEEDPVWRRKDPRERWVCPYCLTAQEHIDLSSTLLMFENAPRLIAQHLASSCQEFKAGAQPKPLDAPLRSSSASASTTSSRSPSRRLAAAGDAGRLATPSEPTGRISEPVGRTQPSDTGSSRLGSARLPALDLDLDSGSGPLPEALDGPRASNGGARVESGRVRRPRDAQEPPPSSPGTTLEKLRASGEYTLIDEREVARPAGGQGRRGRDAADWRREIEEELASVKMLSPAMSGEILPPRVEEGPAGDLAEALRRLRAAERGLEAQVLVLSAAQPRGDFAELLDLGQERLGVLVGGVAGDGPEAPLVAALARNLVRQHVGPERCPAEVLRAVNAGLFGDLEGGNFLSVFLGVLDLPSMRLRVARAGLSAPVVVNAGRAPRLTPLQTEGMVMGIDRGPLFDAHLEPKTFELGPGDLLVAFNNAFLEARGPGGDEFGVERMHQLAERYGTHEIEYFTDKFQEYYEAHFQPRPRPADACLIVIKREGRG